MTKHRPTSILPAEQTILSYYHVAPAGVTLQDILDPAYWTHVAFKLRPHYRIIVDAEDGAWVAELFVRYASRQEARCAVLSFTEIEGKVEMPADAAPEFEVRWRGPTAKWSVVRLSDGEIMTDGKQDKKAAEQWLANYNARVAA